MYKNTITQETNTSNTYIGLTSTTFKERLSTHTNSFKQCETNQTGLSEHIHKLKQKNIQHTLKWEIVDRAKTFNPVTGICALCTREKFYITFKPEWSTLNKKSEIFAHCRHKLGQLLIPRPKEKT